MSTNGLIEIRANVRERLVSAARVDSFQAPQKSASEINKEVRKNYQAVNPNCTVKLIIQPRVYGVRGTGGNNHMAKSAIRLALDTKVIEPTEHKENSVKNREKTLTAIIDDATADEAVSFLNDFELNWGGKCSHQFQEKAKAYKEAKAQICRNLNISLDSQNRPIFANDKQSIEYFEALKGYTYNGYELYVSVKPDGVRATRSKCFRTTNLNELLSNFSSVTFS